MQQDATTSEIVSPLHPVTTTKHADGEIVRIGKEIYERDLKNVLDTPENQGRLVALGIVSGDYLMGRDSAEVIFGMLNKRPDAHVYLLRVGRRAAISLGGWNGKR